MLRQYIDSKILCFFNLHKYSIGIKYVYDDRYDKCSVCQKERIVRDISGAASSRFMRWAMDTNTQKRRVIVEKIDRMYPMPSPIEPVISWIADEDYI